MAFECGSKYGLVENRVLAPRFDDPVADVKTREQYLTREMYPGERMT
jgi:hypothetical protein